MMTMRLDRLNNEPVLELRWVAKRNPFGSVEAAQALLGVLETAGRMRPAVAMGKFSGPFDVAVLAARMQHAKEASSLVLRRLDPEAEYTFYFDADDDKARLVARFMLEEFADESQCNQLVKLLEGLIATAGVAFARAHDEADTALSDDHRQSPLVVPAEIDDVYWLTIWGNELVEKAGRERVTTTPAHRLRELPGGPVMLLTRPTPIDARLPEARHAQARALAHLRPDLDEASIVRRLAERSRRLGVVEPTWSDEIAPLYALLVRDERMADRPTVIERLNARGLEPVTEIREAVLPAQGSATEILDDYDDRAEQLIALLEKQVPNISSFDPAIVPHLDYWAWRFGYAGYDRADVEADLVPAYGAYVALVMIKHLGGTLVPRRKLDESQVVIGGKAYLPFLRARHMLATRDAALSCSMTQFIATAKQG